MTDPCTVVLLVRHGRTDAVATRLVSRLPGVPLNAIGRAEVARVRAVLAREPIAAVYSSPLERTIETATPIAAQHEIDVRPCDPLIEVDFGEWTGRTFSELDQRRDWHEFNQRRSTATVPGGESAPDVQARIVAGLLRLHQQHPGETIVAVSHADVIRAALLHYSGRSLDEWRQIEIAPASVSAVRIDASNGEILYINMCAPAEHASVDKLRAQ